jgi:iron complex outermembrane receptor protein
VSSLIKQKHLLSVKLDKAIFIVIIMKFILSLLLFTSFIFSANAQVMKNSLQGKILDENQNALPGASVIIIGTKYGVNANASGDYLFTHIPAGDVQVQASYVGFNTLIVDYRINPGDNVLNLTLNSKGITLEGVTVTSQKREQQVLDVPITMNVINSGFMENNNINSLDALSVFVPGLLVRMQGVDRPSFVIRGLTSDEVSPSAQPRISVFYNNVPVSRANGAAVELFDMQQVDVLKGPQGTLFGRGAEIGSINYISRKPDNIFNGYISAGTGNYNLKELRGAINIPVIRNKFLVRAAGIYDYQDGYIRNTFGGKLNGRNTFAGRLSASYIPGINNKISFVMNYQKDKNPGLGFMSMNYPNKEGSTDPYSYLASLEQGKNLADNRDIFDAALTMKHSFNVNNYLTSISSYRKVGSFSRWDGDGTAAAAIDMSEDNGARQFYQELRHNYSVNNKLTGSTGSSYWFEKASQNYWFSPDEQDMFHLFFNTGYLVTPDGLPFPVTNLPPDPQLGPLAGLPLATDHQEENLNDAINQALEVFADANYQLTDKISVTAGIRLISEWSRLSNSAAMTGGSPSTLGFLSGNYPNLFFKPSDEKEISTNDLALTWRGGLKYSFSENVNVFANYALGRRPKVLQFTSAGVGQVLAAESVNSYDLGLKAAISKNAWFDLGIFYYKYQDFQTSAWVADPSTGEFNYIVKDGGKADSYGAEANIRVSVLNGLSLFGNYAYIHNMFADNDINGLKQEYAGNMFRLTPENSYAIGLNARVRITGDIYLFGIPSWSYKSKIFFEDANTPALSQDGYGLLNLNAGVESKSILLSFFGSNILDQKYILSAGNTGSLFGDPTQIPGPPRMFGTKLTWKF